MATSTLVIRAIFNAKASAGTGRSFTRASPRSLPTGNSKGAQEHHTPSRRRSNNGTPSGCVSSSDDSEVGVRHRVHPQMEKPAFIKSLSVDTTQLPPWHGFDFENKSLLMAVLSNPFDEFPRLFPHNNQATKSPVARRGQAWQTSIAAITAPFRYASQCVARIFGTSSKQVVPL